MQTRKSHMNCMYDAQRFLEELHFATISTWFILLSAPECSNMRLNLFIFAVRFKLYFSSIHEFIQI